MSGIVADMAYNKSGLFELLCKIAAGERIHLTLLLIIVVAISALCLAPICSAQGDYEIRNAIVTPEYGYEDFTYSADVLMSEQAASRVGVVAVTRFSLKLIIYNDGKEIQTDSIDQTGMGKSSFSFGPYNFKNRFNIAETENASFKFIFYAGGQKVAETKKLLGPTVKPPTTTGIQYDRTPYFFQGLTVSAGFKDQDGLDPKPTCHMVITGPLGKSDSKTWTTDDISCRSSGKSGYACTLNNDLSSYRDGGNFSFMLVYNNLKMSPIAFGPYNITLRTYAPTAETPRVARNLDYTNFTITSTVRDVSAWMEASNPIGRLIISQPSKGEITYTSSEPEISSDKLVFTWTQDSVPSLFNNSDVQLSKQAPFMARLEYANDKYNLSARSSNVTFNVVEEVPKLVNPSIPENVYVSTGETNDQDMDVTVAFLKGPGDLAVRLTGPNMNINTTERPTPLSGNKYLYKWQIPFDDSHANNNYTLSLSFVNDRVEGGRYDFDDRTIHVSPISVQFLQGTVTAPVGQWNDSYTYSTSIDSTVPFKVQLQIYDPCSNDWIAKQTKDLGVGTSQVLNWTLQPFAYECQEMLESPAKYRFKAFFAGEEVAASRAYDGPSFAGAEPSLVSITPVGDPMRIYVSDEGATASVSAIVDYAAGHGQATLRLTGSDGSLRMEEQSNGIAEGRNRYQYDWSLPFDEADAQKSFNLSITYRYANLIEDYPLVQKTVSVLPIAIDFSNGKTYPEKGLWNDTFIYSVHVNSSVSAAARLEVYNPCTHSWVQRATGKITAGERMLNMSANPFRSRCSDSEGIKSSFRFAASFEDRTIESEVYFGPSISGGQTKLISFDIEKPILHVKKDEPGYQLVKAVVDFPQGKDAIELSITGPDGAPKTEVMNAAYLGATQYLYTWSKEFNADDAGNYTIAIRNANAAAAGGTVTATGTMRVISEEESNSGFEPKAVGDVDYQPVLFVTPEKEAFEKFSARVFSPGGKGAMTLDLTGKDRDREAEMNVTDLGGNVYRYDYAEPFNSTSAGNSYRFNPNYELDGKRYSLFDEHRMQVALEGTQPEPIWEPKLILDYDATLYVPAGGKADQVIHATINYSENGGILKLNLTGPGRNVVRNLSGREIGVDKHLYEAVVPFYDQDIGKNFTISLTFNHSDLGDYRFADRYMRVLKKAPLTQPGTSGTESGATTNRVFDDSNVTVIGNVTPEIGVIQAWDEKDTLHALTYTLNLENWSSQQVPWIELSVKAPGSNQPWKIVGDKKRYDPSTGSVSWTLKPFWETPFMGEAEYRFLIDGAETRSFEGPDIIAVISNAGDSLNGQLHNFWATVNSSENLTVCLVCGNSAIPELINTWTTKGKCYGYSTWEGEKPFSWQIPEAQTLPYYDFDIQRNTTEPML